MITLKRNQPLRAWNADLACACGTTLCLEITDNIDGPNSAPRALQWLLSHAMQSRDWCVGDELDPKCNECATKEAR